MTSQASNGPSYGTQVCDFQTRVAWRLDKEQPRRRRDRALPCRSVGLVHERVVYPEAREQFLDQAERTPVNAALSHYVIPVVATLVVHAFAAG